MANFGQIQQGISSGYQIGRSTGGGRLGGLASAINKVANKVKQERAFKQDLEQKKGLLGYTARLEGKIEPTAEGGVDVPGLGRMKPIKIPKEWKPGSKVEALEFEAAKAGMKSSLGKKEFHTDVKEGIGKIKDGADPFQVFQALSQTYPKDSTWLKRQLIEKSSTSQSIDDLLEELK